MAIHHRTLGIILQKEDRGESDRLFTIFSRDFGKLKLRAISERKITSKLRGGLELFYVSEIEFIQGKAQKTLTDSIPRETFGNLRTDLRRMRIAYRVAGIVEEIVRGEEADEKTWRLLQEVFYFLDRDQLKTDDLKLVAYYFLWNILSLAGYMPQLADLERNSSQVASTIHLLIEKNIVDLADTSLEGIHNPALKDISQEHLLKVLQN